MMEVKRLYYVYIESEDGGSGCINLWAHTMDEARLMAKGMIIDSYYITDIVKISIH